MLLQNDILITESIVYQLPIQLYNKANIAIEMLGTILYSIKTKM